MTGTLARVDQDFPALAQTIHGQYPLVYLDNAATTFKARPVIAALNRYYSQESANIHRGVHTLSQLATERYEAARATVQTFIGAEQVEDIIFTSGTTAAINMVAQGFVRKRLSPGDEILITEMEHHSNIVPWQMLREQTGAQLKVAPINDLGEVRLDAFAEMLSPRTKMVSIGYVSNALGTINPVKQMVALAHRIGAPVLVDAAQAVATIPVNVTDLDCDFLAFSGHKIFGPTGTGVLYGKQAILEQMDPVFGGGDMILSVTFEKTVYNHIPYRFEPGTPHIAGVIGLGAAIDYVTRIGMETIAAHDRKLARLAAERLSTIPGVRLIGEAADKTSIASFVLEHAHPHDIGTILDNHGVAIRAGHHCAQPVMQHFGVEATARASFSLYNTERDIDRLMEAVLKVKEVFV
ncbi:MAG: cysteine desulfurase [Planctomycetes bacterium]|nr:cysteine desulfurase [Planctomycetota bacterium]